MIDVNVELVDSFYDNILDEVRNYKGSCILISTVINIRNILDKHTETRVEMMLVE
jgi:hypothetical protein